MISVVIVLAVTCLIVSSMLMSYKSMWGSPKEKYTNQKQTQKQKQIQLQIAKKQLQKKLAKQKAEKAEQDKLRNMTLREYRDIFSSIIRGEKGSNTEELLTNYLLSLPVDIRSAFISVVGEGYWSNGNKFMELLPPNIRKETEEFEKNQNIKLQNIAKQSKFLTEDQLKNKVNIAKSLSMTELVKYIRSLPMMEALLVLEFMGKTESEKVMPVMMSLPLLEYKELISLSMIMRTKQEPKLDPELIKMTVNEYKNIFNSMKNNELGVIKYVINLPPPIGGAFISLVVHDGKDESRFVSLLPSDIRQKILTFNEKNNQELVIHAKNFRRLNEGELRNLVKNALSLSLNERVKYIMKLGLTDGIQVLINMPNAQEILMEMPLLYAMDIMMFNIIIRKIDRDAVTPLK